MGQLSTAHLFWEDNDWSSWLPWNRRSLLGDIGGNQRLHSVSLRKPQGGAHAQARGTFCEQLCRTPSTYRHGISCHCKFKVQTLYVCNDLLSCVCCFLLLRPLVAPTEQLVLTTIRQETSDLPDQGASATMRARLADRFDKSEFAKTTWTMRNPSCMCS